MKKGVILGMVLTLGFLSVINGSRAIADDASNSAPAKGEKLQVDNLKEKYWAKGDESELKVVQNRTYTKAHKFELGVFGGWTTTDPFLSVQNIGGSVGFHISEYFAVEAVGWKSFVSNSAALDTLQAEKSVTANTNDPHSFLGGQVVWNPIYGKLSVLGLAIIYFDLHGEAGAGLTYTETGKEFTPYVGLGQQFYLNRFLSLRLDYRFMRYTEDIYTKYFQGSSLGPYVGTRTNYSNIATIGISCFLDVF